MPLHDVAPSGLFDGWVTDGALWTYASATTFTVSGDQTMMFSKGTRVKLTQTTVKFFVVVGSSYAAETTTVTITGGSDYTLANAAISGNYYSYAANPQGYPEAFNFSPVYTGFSADPSGGACKFSVVGGLCTFVHTRAAGTSNATGFTITMPIQSSMQTIGLAQVRNNGALVSTPGALEAETSGTMDVFLNTSGGNFTNANGKNASFSITYPI